MEMEGAVQTGREFWSKIEKKRASIDTKQIETGYRENELRQAQQRNGTASEAVINRIFDR